MENETKEQSENQGYTCDFCGEIVQVVRRVALDRDYDRLHKPHKVQYACPQCSEQKELAREGFRQG